MLRCSIAWVLLSLLPLVAVAQPSRVVSVNLCADQLVLDLADSEQVAAISFNAQDAALSWQVEKARKHEVVRLNAEDILRFSPDIVLMGEYGERGLKEHLQEQGVQVVSVGMPHTLEGIMQQVKDIAALLGQQQRGRERVLAMQQVIEQARSLATARKSKQLPRVGVYYLNGYTDGKGTLMDEVIHIAGGSNVASEYGVSGIGYLPLEKLVATPPDLLISNHYKNTYPVLGNKILHHPALKRALSGKHLPLAGHRLSCATPDYAALVLEIARYLHKEAL